MSIISLLLEPIPLAGLLLIAFLPWRWLWRLLIAFGLFLLVVVRSFLADDGDSAGYALGVAIIFIVFVAWAAAIGARILFELIRQRYRPARPSAPSRLLKWADRALAAAAGSVAALHLFISFGWATQGLSHGYILHGFVVVAGLAAAGAALRHTGHLPGLFLLGGGLALVALSTWGALVFPRTVVASALKAADGRLFCIGLFERGRPPRSAEDLTFLTMDKSKAGHAGLLVQDKSGLIATHWSYHARSFSDPNRISGVIRDRVIPCTPGKKIFAPTDETE